VKGRRKVKSASMEIVEESLPKQAAAAKARNGRSAAVPASSLRKGGHKAGKAQATTSPAASVKKAGRRLSASSTGSRGEGSFEWDILDFGEPFSFPQDEWESIAQTNDASASCSSLCPSPITFSGKSGADAGKEWVDHEDFGWFGDVDIAATSSVAKIEGEFDDDSWLEHSESMNSSSMDTESARNEDVMNVQHVAREISRSAETRALQRMQLQSQM